jgi:2-methylcitrate dehydratase PrpD
VRQAKVELVADRALVDPAAPRSGAVEATLADGRVVRHFTRHPPGTKENPLSAEAVAEKARGLMEPVVGKAATARLIRDVQALEQVRDVRALVRSIGSRA